MVHFFSNKDLAKLLRQISAAYQAKSENRFKIIAYENAASSVEHATSELKDLWEDGKLDTIPGLGKSIQMHIDELFKTGRVKHFESVKKDLPQGMFKLLEISGMGPKSAYKLAKELKIKSVADLEKAAKNNKIKVIPGFGQKSEKDILTAILELKGKERSRYLLTEAFAVAQRVLDHLKDHSECKRAEALGSLRRMLSTVGDIDIAVASQKPETIIKHFTEFKEIKRIIDAGNRKSSILLLNGMRVDLIVQPPRAFGALLQHFTGSKNHNIHLRETAIRKKMSVSDYGIKLKGKLHEFKTEPEFYKFLSMDYIEPELREDSGEIEAATNYKLPKLVKLGDIKGDLHIHTNYPIEPSHDLGKNTMEEMIKKAVDLNYEYIGLSDHSPGFYNHSKKQIHELVKKRSEKIEHLKSSYKNIRILNLLEIDILTSSQLSVPKESLKLLDGAIAGIHSSHGHNKEMITKRLLLACNSPYVKVITHPTGRLLLKRESYEADWEKVFEACKKTDTVLEINSWPTRLDLTDTLVKEAVKQKIRLVINTDSHAKEQMDNMFFGVSVARRGWATKNDVVNTLPWLEFKKIFRV